MTVYMPSLDDVKAMAGKGNVVPVYREVAADLETPVSAYLKVARGEHSFLLESVEGGERLARYSFIGTEPYRVLRTADGDGDPLLQIEDELRRYQPVPVPGLPRFHGGAVGYLAYEVARYYEKLPVPDADPQGLPESVFMFTDTLLVFDHLQHNIKVVSHARLDGDIDASYRQAIFKIEELVTRLAKPLAQLPYLATSAPKVERGMTSNHTEEQFKKKVEKAKEYIFKGGFMFSMCSATDTYDIALSAAGVDIVEFVYDGDPADPQAQDKLQYDRALAFKDFRLIIDPMVYRFSDIDVTQEAARRGPNTFFTLFDFSAKNDPVPTMLIQNHVNAVAEFLGQTTGFRRTRLKSGALILGEVENTEEVKYIHGQFGRGTFTFLGGHDPEDYQHMVGDPPTELSRYKHSPGYRLILNNVLFPAAEKKKQRT